ncbi:MAG: oligosaccharide repeat unit polymerase [Prevotella sp.]|nr:oligosaccharide repeat unit polymerase [Prevotella sp.]
MEIAILIILAVMLIAFRIYKIGDYFSPWFITAAIWFVMIFAMQFQGDLLYPLSDQFLVSISLWIPVLCVSSLLTYYLLPSVKDENAAVLSDVSLSDKLFNVIYVISMIITPMYLYQMLKIVMMFDTADMLYNIRILAVFGDQDFGFLNYSYILNQVLLVIALWKYPKIPKWQLITIYIAILLSCFAIMEKGGLFFAFFATIFVLFERGYIKVRTIIIWALVIFFLFFLFNLSRQMQSDNNNTNETTIFDFISMYILSPPVAFGMVDIDVSEQFGSHTFETIYLFLERFGYNVEVHTKLQEFVNVPISTNVYTVLQPFYQDFGYTGVTFFALVYGLLSGWAYRQLRNGSGIGKCLYTYIAQVLILQFYQENIMLSLVAFIQFIFFVVILTQRKLTFNLFPRKSSP